MLQTSRIDSSWPVQPNLAAYQSSTRKRCALHPLRQQTCKHVIMDNMFWAPLGGEWSPCSSRDSLPCGRLAHQSYDRGPYGQPPVQTVQSATQGLNKKVGKLADNWQPPNISQAMLSSAAAGVVGAGAFLQYHAGEKHNP